MATNFPTSADDATTVGGDSLPAAGTALSDSTAGHPSHSDLHENVGDAVQAVEAKVGTGASTPAANTVLTGTGSGTSGWATVSTAMIGDTQVTTAKLADDAVTAAKIHDDAVTKVVVTDTTDATAFPALFESATGSLTPHTDAGLTYNASNATLTATTFVGALTGDASGSSGSCTGNAATATALATARAINGVDFDGTAAITVAAAAGTLTGSTLASGVTASSLTSVGTLGSLTVGGDVDINGLVKVNDGSSSAPTFTFDSDEGNGMYLSGTDELAFTTGGSQRVKITAGGTLQWIGSSAIGGPLTDTSTTTGYRYVLQNQTFGTFQDFDSSRARKEQITNVTATDSGQWIDALQPVTFIERWLGEGDEPADNKEWREADMQVGFISDDILASSNASHFAQVTDNGEGGLDPAGWKWECVIAAAVAELKSVRARLEALEG